MHKYIVAIVITLASASILAQETAIHLALNTFDEYVMDNAPRAKLIQKAYARDVAESEASLQWRNPEFEFEAERLSNDAGTEKETAYMLGKDITMPWVHAQHKSAQKEHLVAMEAKRDAELLLLIAEMKSDYVELQLTNTKRERLSRLESVIDDITEYAADQYQEGLISDLHQQLTRLSLMNIRGSLVSLKQQQRELVDQFKTDLGLGEEQNVVLTTRIGFTPQDPARIEPALINLEQNPEYQAHLHRQQTLKKQIALEKMSFLPEMHITGGYKEAGDDFKGYVIGLSVPLPIFDRNRPKVEQSRIDYESAVVDFEVFQRQLNRNIHRHREAISDYSTYFQTNGQTFDRLDDTMENNIFAFRQGFLTIGDLVNVFMMYQETIDTYYEFLTGYYKTIFTLEALIGESLVSF